MRYKPLRDPILWGGIFLYLMNKFWLESQFASAFLKGYVTDLMAIPIGVPVLVWLMQKARVRGSLPPQNGEVLIVLLIFSVLFELVIPSTTSFGGFAAGDVYDVLAYIAGGVIGLIWWRFRYDERTVTS